MQQRYERDAEAFLQGISREEYLTGAGLKETLEIAPFYEQYSGLFSREAVADLLARRADGGGAYLAEFAAQGYLQNAVKTHSEEHENAVLAATVEWDGRTIPYRSATIVVANEPDAGRRHGLNARLAVRTAELNPRLRQRLGILHDQARALGFADYVTLCDELGGLDLAWLEGAMRGLLARTAAPYYARLEEQLATIGVAREAAEAADTSHLFRAPQFDALFPKDRLLSTLRCTLAGLGIDIDRQPNVYLDVESRPLKSPRAFCAPIRVPDEVKLVISPHGGQDDYHALLHETGHAQLAAHTAAELDFAAKYLGDNAVTEGYAFVFDNLMRSPRWLTDVLGVADPSAFLRFINFRQLYFLRRYAAKLIYELRLHRGDAEGLAPVYAGTLGESLGVKIKEENYLTDVDDAFYVARYLRAWIFEVQLRRVLLDRWGEAWFAQPEAGEFLVSLWRDGQRYTAPALAQHLGYTGLDAEPIIAELLAG